jgi:hypothetical protein
MSEIDKHKLMVTDNNRPSVWEAEILENISSEFAHKNKIKQMLLLLGFFVVFFYIVLFLRK